jgi:hypothetical protein
MSIPVKKMEIKTKTPILGKNMKRSKTYRKGEHIYVKTGSLKEARLVQEPKRAEFEFSPDTQEVYADLFPMEIDKKGITIRFGKSIFGTDQAKFKRAIRLDIRTAREFLKILTRALGSAGEKSDQT